MYPNIPTDKCCERLERWFKLLPNQSKWFEEVKAKILIDTIKLATKGNQMRFGDLFVKKVTGVTVDTSPAPPITNLCVGIFEEEYVVGKFKDCIDALDIN